MTIAKYSKNPIKVHKTPIHKDELVVREIPRYYKENRSSSIWEFFRTSYTEFIDMLVESRVIGFVFPFLLMIFGIVLLYQQIWPEVEQKVLESEGFYDQGTTQLVQGDYIQKRQLTLSNPGSKYFKSLTTNAFTENILRSDPISENYTGNFNLTLPTIDLYDLQVQSNVDSGNENIYKNVLKTSLAHMKGTGLPISSIKNNIVIYGHSSNDPYYQKTQDIVGAFSRLQKLKIGDTIKVNMEGTQYKYKVYKTKIVKPTDTSIINGTSNQKSLTLFTCFPNGNSNKRLVVVARPVN